MSLGRYCESSYLGQRQALNTQASECVCVCVCVCMSVYLQKYWENGGTVFLSWNLEMHFLHFDDFIYTFSNFCSELYKFKLSFTEYQLIV